MTHLFDIPWLLAGCAGLVVVVVVIIYHQVTVKGLRGRLTQLAAQTEEQSRRLETERRELQVIAREEGLKLRSQLEEELRLERADLEKMRRRLEERDDNLDKRKGELERQGQDLQRREKELTVTGDRVASLIAEAEQRLEEVAQMTPDQAREQLLARVEEEFRPALAQRIVRLEEEAREEGERRARKVVAQAIQRCAVDQTAETTVSVVPLPSDELKGRIIGREGRNIRAFEKLTGVDLIVDDTPEAVVISGFDPVRREVARLALTELLTDGRIHPGRIEELVEKSQQAVDEMIREAGEHATVETGVTGMHPELVRLLGRLRFRTSFGQNVLRHSIEVSHLAGAMAAEIGARVALARRAGLLHDLGKAVDFERDGPHALIGAEIATSRGESKDVVEALVSHHDDEPVKSVEGALVQAADAISAGRPGARREALESYLKRLDALEKIANEFEGVEKSFAIQAGREIRVMVKPEKIDDLAAHRLARAMATRIEEAMDYPGQIRVTVIRETRAIEFAK
jgi:ribonuclease Y